MKKQEIISQLNIKAYYQHEVSSFKEYDNFKKAMALCPFHDDHHPSLSIDLETGNWYCFACQTGGSLIDFHMKKYGLSYEEAILALAQMAGVEIEKKTIVATYDYTDEFGKLLFQVVRYEPKAFIQRQPDSKGGWKYNLDGVKPVLYNLPSILKADIVYIVEGEKDVETLEGLGLTATCNPMGAGKWKEEYNQYLKDKHVIILPDNDSPGEKHALDIAKNLYGIAKSIKIVRLPGLPEKGDISDWIKQGHTKDELLKLVDETQKWEPNKTAIIIKLDEIEPKPIEWLWPGYIPLGKIVMLDGNPDIGKSTIALDLASRITTGKPMPDGQKGEEGGVVILTAEDDIEDTIVPRIIAAGGDNSKIVALKGVKTEDGDRYVYVSDLKAIKEAIKEVNARLLIVDPLMAFLPVHINSWSDQGVRSVLTPLAQLAAETGISVLLIRHLNKRNDTYAIYRGGGSIGIIGAARVGFLAGKDPEDENVRVLACIKNNLAPLPPSLKYTIVPKNNVSKIEWLGTTERTADELLSITNHEERTAIEDAKAFLKDILSNGSVAVKDIQRQAEEVGISERTLKRAKKILGIKSKKSEFEGRWVWQLPDEECQECQDDRRVPKKYIGTLREKEAHQMLENTEDDRRVPTKNIRGGLALFDEAKGTGQDNSTLPNQNKPVDEVIDLGDAEIEVII